MDTLSYKTISANKETVQKEWVVVDATDQVVGRFCSKVAKLLRGKYKPNFTPNVDCGDNVIIINAEKVRFTGKNGIDKILRHAVKGMLPKGILGRSLMSNLYIFEGAEHNKEAQKPKNIDINQYK